MKKQGLFTIKFIAYTGMMTAIVYVCTLIGIPFPAFNFNIGDSAILICGALFNPLSAMIAGGLGSFLADLTTYPATMLYTLVIKAIEGLVAGLLFQALYKWYDKAENPDKKRFTLKVVFAVLISLACSLFMAGGYFICKAFMYGTIESALTSLPKNVLQAVVSTTLASLVLYATRLEKLRPKTYASIVDTIKNATHNTSSDPQPQDAQNTDFDASDDTEEAIIVDGDHKPCDSQDDTEKTISIEDDGKPCRDKDDQE